MDKGMIERYKLYAKSNRCSPKEMMVWDKEIFGEDNLEGFRAWNKVQTYEWAQDKNTNPHWALLYLEEVSAWIESKLKETVL